MTSLEERKIAEREFHDRYRAVYEQGGPACERFTSNKKFYAIDRKSRQFVLDWLRQNAGGARALDYGCGGGSYAWFLAEHAARVDGIDISPASIALCQERAAARGLAAKCHFQVMDCENLEFSDNSFDVICESGVLHHLDVERVWPQIVRVLAPGGSMICTEALAHNPVFRLYRRLTPELRTAWETEHILRVEQIRAARRWFGRVDLRFFHLVSLAAVPFRNMWFFEPLLGTLERIDSLVLRAPLVQRQAWMAVFVLSEPRKAGR
ncbi:MAG: class I SAM-dependent methyltransferase [Deltaproteobacteria bacterium]|nr:class I SAM-dependent methyltransferase [Deltaproteobacteria bacterium]